MNRLVILFLFFFGVTSIQAQIHEVGVYIGGSNYIGDIGPTNYIAPNELAYGFLYKWNKSPRHSWRVSFTHAKISSKDKNSDMPARIQRGYEFENQLNEVAVGMEFNFFNFNLHEFGPKFTPYVYSGLSYIHYDGLFFKSGEAKFDNIRRSAAIPMTIGVKTRLFEHLILGLEVSAKYTFKDDLDGSYATNENLHSFKFGNINNNDWYVFSGFTVTYSFGNKPCYCND